MKRLLHNLIIVLPMERNDIESHGLIIPSTTEDTTAYGKVTHVGKEVSPEDLIVGEHVLYRPQSAEDLVIDGKTHKLMTLKAVIGPV